MAMRTTRWKPGKGKTWRDKLDAEHPNHGKIVRSPGKRPKSWGKRSVLIPRPRDVDALMRKVRKGKLVTASMLRAKLAEQAGADMACPLTTGIFINIAANAAEEDRQAGRKRITPYWRTVKNGGKLNDKYPGGVKAQAARLREEGFVIISGKSNRPLRVADYESKLARL